MQTTGGGPGRNAYGLSAGGGGSQSARRRLWTLGLGALVSVGILSGCGGGEGTEDAVEPTPSEFIAEADRLCARSGEQLEATIATLPPARELTAPDAPPGVIEEAGEAGTRLAEIGAELEHRLRALAPPPDFASRWDRALDALGRRADAAADAADAAKAGDRAAFLEGFQRFMREGTTWRAELRGYGFEACGR